MLELAALLGEGTGAVMDPLVAVDLLALAGNGAGGGIGAGQHDGAGGVRVRRAGDDGVDAGLYGYMIYCVSLVRL